METELLANLKSLAGVYAEATGLGLSTVCQRAFGDWRFFERLKDSDRASFTVRKYDAAVVWFAANWPEGSQWPERIARPAPAPKPAAGQPGAAA